MTPINYLLHLISVGFLACKDIGNASACLSISIRINRLRHFVVSITIIKQGTNLIHDLIIVGTYKMYCTTRQSLWMFCSITHYKNRLTKSWGLLLNTTRVCENNCRFLHQIHKLKILQWFNEEEIRTSQVFTKYLMDWFAYIRIKVHRIYEIYIWVFL